MRVSLPKSPPPAQSGSQLEEVFSKSCVLRGNDLKCSCFFFFTNAVQYFGVREGAFHSIPCKAGTYQDYLEEIAGENGG
jgi:hypothetical protein